MHHHFNDYIKVHDFTQYLTNFFLKNIEVFFWDFHCYKHYVIYIHLCVFVWLLPWDIFLEMTFGVQEGMCILNFDPFCQNASIYKV